MFITYTPQDANRALPDVKRRFNTIVSQKNHVIAIQQELERTHPRRHDILRIGREHPALPSRKIRVVLHARQTHVGDRIRRSD